MVPLFCILFFVFEVFAAGGGAKYGDWKAVNKDFKYTYALSSKYLAVIEVTISLVRSSSLLETWTSCVAPVDPCVLMFFGDPFELLSFCSFVY